ncbi:MAG TPA: hypothetical protein DCX07_01970 [Phycisphaerales bacterium]|nr:hypothetical protein [Phycisphaerales bacterium]
MNEQRVSGSHARKLIEVEAIIVAYAMSRLDAEFLHRFSYRSWRAAFADSGQRLGVPLASMKNLRDEFDPLHPNARSGWHQRPLRPNRQRVLGEFSEASDEALIEVVGRILRRDAEVQQLVVTPIAATRERVEDVAERLRTGRLAEEYFLQHSAAICGVDTVELLDRRQDACGFDFGRRQDDHLAIEVKGLKALSGQILFTDHEWQQANRRQDKYWLVVIGGIAEMPRPRLVRNPATTIEAVSTFRHSTVVSWRARISIV